MYVLRFDAFNRYRNKLHSACAKGLQKVLFLQFPDEPVGNRLIGAGARVRVVLDRGSHGFIPCAGKLEVMNAGPFEILNQSFS